MRYRYLSVTVILLIIFQIAAAQNLVPNPDFETYNNCPSNLLSIPFSNNYNNFPTITSWTNPAKLSSPDYLNSCAASVSGLKIPYSTFGYQQPVSGNAYAGIIAFQGEFNNGSLQYDYREYLQNKLTQPLTAGRQYCISFHVSPTVSAAFNFNYVAIDEIGINLSAQRNTDTLNYTMSLPYDVENNPGNFISDTSKWYKVQGVYMASGGENWLTLGNFKNSNNAPVFQNIYPQTPDPNRIYWAYLFIDDVSVVEITSADTIRNVALDTVVCKLTGLNILLNASVNGVAYNWNNGSSASQIIVSDTGTYWCESKLDCGLTIDTFHIRYQLYKPLDLGKDTFNCFSQPITISSNNYYSSYLWNTGATTNTITTNQSGDYILTVSDTCGIQKDTIAVAIQSPTLPPLVSDTTICQKSFSPGLVVNGSNIKWYVPNSNIGSPTQPYISTAQNGTQTLYVTQTIGHCESPKVPLHIKVKYKPVADIGDYIRICKGVDTVIGRPYPEVNYLWNNNEMVCCIKPQTTGIYQLTISNDCGTSSDSAFVEISPCDECLFVPTAFTPNKDGRNDVFYPVIKCPVTEYHIDIFNRWGEKIFSATDPTTTWNGESKTGNFDAGVYVYTMQYRAVNTGVVKHLKGNITLIR